MHELGLAVRILMGVQSVVLCYRILQTLRTVAALDANSPGRVFIFLTPYMAAVAVGCAVLAWMMGRGNPRERKLLQAISILSLINVPVGTLTGLVGLYYLRQTKGMQPAAVPAPAASPAKPAVRKRTGDGTGYWTKILVALVALGWVWLAVRPIYRLAVSRGMPETPFGISVVAIFVIAVYTAVFFHELGHYIAGMAVYMKMVGFRIGAFEVRESAGHWHFKFVPAGLIGGGQTQLVPEKDGELRERAMFVTIGGPVGSLLAGAGALALLLAIAPDGHALWLSHYLMCLAAIAFGDLLLNLIPTASGVSYSDGARLWQLWKRGPWCDFLCTTFYMGLARTTPMRPRDWPREMVERAVTFAEGQPIAWKALAAAYGHYYDSGDITRAISCLERANAAVQQGTDEAGAFAMERAYVEAIDKNDAAEAHRWLRMGHESGDSVDYWRAHAAVLAAEGRTDEARAALGKGTELLAKTPAVGLYELDREQYRKIGQYINARESESLGAALAVR